VPNQGDCDDLTVVVNSVDHPEVSDADAIEISGPFKLRYSGRAGVIRKFVDLRCDATSIRCFKALKGTASGG
jgi:hypothetical protein